ncbi:MAG: C2 domain-containing protein, partial [Deltaproteobacteria bacterium]|nr:C2 domain-containing protein [Deltaproteobacteria bacterium]
AATCAGCCDIEGTCVEEPSEASCGLDGAACSACADGATCTDGVCTTPVGAECGDELTCGEDETCVYNPTETETFCLPRCSGSTPCELLTDQCLALPDGSGVCVPAPASDSGWSLRAVSATVDGSINWEQGDDDPDPYMSAWLGPAFVGNTPTRDNNLAPVWNHTYSGFGGVYIPSNFGDADLWLKDQDAGGDGNIALLSGLNLQPYWAGQVHRYVFRHQGALELIVEVVPAN